ncbi:MAG: amino acid ABC transporter permease [Proteobacteria bacterium]|nr:amino acid ABC transporter permease [Pseudomonadota bacterium]
MGYVFQFGVVWDHRWDLLYGAWLTLRLAVAASVLGLLLACLVAYARQNAPRPVRAAAAAYVEFLRNTPLLVQLFVLYFSLPMLGLRLTADTAALIGLSLNFGAYGSEILRGGMLSIPQGQIEAARALGLSAWRIFRHVVLMPALNVAYPALASQFVLMMLGSSVVSAISATDLTAITNTLQSTTFRSFEFYFVATALYLAMALALRFALGLAYRVLFPPALRSGTA